jgi:hypothetical protein
MVLPLLWIVSRAGNKTNGYLAIGWASAVCSDGSMTPATLEATLS